MGLGLGAGLGTGLGAGLGMGFGDFNGFHQSFGPSLRLRFKSLGQRRSKNAGRWDFLSHEPLGEIRDGKNPPTAAHVTYFASRIAIVCIF